MKKLLFLGLISLLVVFYALPRSANATSIQITPTADGSALTYYFTGIWLVVDSVSTFLYVEYLYLPGIDEARAALEFDISSLNPNDIVTQVSLDLYAEFADANIELSGYTGDGIIAEVDFGQPHLSPTPPNILLATHDPDPLGMNHIPLDTNFFNSLVGSGESFAGILIRELVPNEFNTFASMEYSNPRLWPTLNIEFRSPNPIPEPTTMFLLGTGLVGVAGAARRRKKNQS